MDKISAMHLSLNDGYEKVRERHLEEVEDHQRDSQDSGLAPWPQ